MKMCSSAGLKAILLGLLLVISACQAVKSPADEQIAIGPPAVAPVKPTLAPAALPPTVPAGDGSLDPAASLASLKQVDDLPFYTMQLMGDYGYSPRPPFIVRSQARPAALPSPWGCTVFAAQTLAGERLLARNFDWYHHPALLLFTDSSDGYASAAMVDISYLGFEQPITDWRPAALETLLRAPQLPFDGLNEAGLAVGMMAVPHAEGGTDPGKVTLDSLQVIRLLLDYAATLDEALALLEQVNVDFTGGPPLHYLIADRLGNSAVVEFIDGQLQVLRSQAAWQVSTNFLFSDEKPGGTSSSCWRYDRAAEALGQAAGILEPDQAMHLLRQVSQSAGSTTLWSVVYHQTSGVIDVVISREYNQVHTFELR